MTSPSTGPVVAVGAGVVLGALGARIGSSRGRAVADTRHTHGRRDGAAGAPPPVTTGATVTAHADDLALATGQVDADARRAPQTRSLSPETAGLLVGVAGSAVLLGLTAIVLHLIDRAIVGPLLFPRGPRRPVATAA